MHPDESKGLHSPAVDRSFLQGLPLRTVPMIAVYLLLPSFLLSVKSPACAAGTRMQYRVRGCVRANDGVLEAMCSSSPTNNRYGSMAKEVCVAKTTVRYAYFLVFGAVCFFKG
uniref:Uncharacterized protein n=1 Tax=Pseudo-nitzschia australis TaxID=44445 RepID=A0A7S4AS66_9STRA|mmetsp:Transcript_16911/g.34781  ORF Transcript_16911/g.34781 Transcript_16911/m.34781 type:complete len:113 (-) Transcript_16911:56-394(-)